MKAREVRRRWGAADADIREANRDIVTNNVVPGLALFTACLDDALRARALTVPSRAHDLVAELKDAGADAP